LKRRQRECFLVIPAPLLSVLFNGKNYQIVTASRTGLLCDAKDQVLPVVLPVWIGGAEGSCGLPNEMESFASFIL